MNKMQQKPKAAAVAAAIALSVAVPISATGCSPQPQAMPSQPDRETLSVSDTSISASSSVAEPLASESTPAQADESASSSAQAAESDADSTLATQLSTDLQTIADASGMQVGTAVIDLATGTYADYRGNESIRSASMIKLVIAAAFLEQVDAGTFSLDTSYTLQYGDIVGGTGSLGSRGTGTTTTYRELVQMMISESDNTATNILINAIGMDAVNAEAAKLELTSTKLDRLMMDYNAIAAGKENYTSANDVAALLRMIYDGTFVGPDYSALMMQALENQQDYGGILGGLPAGVTFAHKTGTLDAIRHDGGIVEGDHPFVVVVLCGGPGFTESGALGTMAQIGGAAYADIAG